MAGSSSDDVGCAGAGGDGLVHAKDIRDAQGQLPKTLPDVVGPSPQEIARHNLTHLPYRSWCRWCVMSRKPNPKHLRSHFAKRDIPLLVGDYAFVRNSVDEDLLTIFVGRMYPTRELVIIPCEQKGEDQYAINRLSNFIKNSGVQKLVYMADQESALATLMEKAIRKVGITGELVSAVPEHSSVGESQSNGRAERAVQEAEDMLRCMKLALEERLSARVTSTTPIMKWMCEHAAATINRFHVHDDGQTAYQRSHGHPFSGYVLEFGEKVFYYVLKRARTKLDRRWNDGIYLGSSQPSNEHFVGLASGKVVRVRGLARVRAEHRWDKERAARIHGTPMDPNEDSIVEEYKDPHRMADAEQIDRLQDDNPHPNVHPDDRAPPQHPDLVRYRITRRDCDLYGYSLELQCKRCIALAAGDSQTTENHNEPCRQRFYDLFVKNTEARFMKWRRTSKEFATWRREQMEKEYPVSGPPPPAPELVDDALDYDIGVPEDPGEDVDLLLDTLVAHGVSKIDAANACLSMTKRIKNTSFYEIYGRGELSAEARRSRRNLNLSGLRVVDLRTCKPDGTPWDLSRADRRQECLQLIQAEDPDWIFVGPPCTQFSSWQNLNHSKMDPNRVKKLVKDARRHLKLACRLYRRQIDAGKFFLHEHPLTASSWQLPEVKKILQAPGVGTTTAHQCMFSLTTLDDSGQPALAKKPTRFMSKSPFMLVELTRFCTKDHPHQQLTDGRAKAAENYPLPLIRAILRGMFKTTQATQNIQLTLTADWDAIMNVATHCNPEAEPCSPTDVAPSSIPKATGGFLLLTMTLPTSKLVISTSIQASHYPNISYDKQ